MNISFCIPLKNNLRYFKQCYSSIKENSFYKNNEIVVFLDLDNDNTEQFLIKNNIKYIKNGGILKGISYGYNRCAEIASNDILMMFHADMILGKNADLNIIKHLKQKTVVSSTRIEPPLHPTGKEKIVMDFGVWPEEDISGGFKKIEFSKFVENKLIENKNLTTRGIFAPWAIYKKDFFDVGMHDELFHSYHEDSDIFNRFILNGMQIIQSWDSLVYHLTCRGGQFQDGLSITKDETFHKMKKRCANEYIRKWGSWINNDEYCYPIINKKYDIGIIINNCNENLLTILEPWCNTLYSDIKNINHIQNILQSDTLFNIKNRIKSINDEKTNDIIISFDGNKFTQSHFNVIMDLSNIITENNETGIFEYDIFTFNIKNLNTYEYDLIKLRK